ncbi:NUDIX domain-containing protein [Vaginisenegalia massiliensis]|uniref:NUDIX domain-containing protein n=1 Tax=Vaginisenegalia massiliensis TaxID=2058294 RepID=UPI0013DE0058|nr:NUDIX domain-containing protein [Vaginisenegalia massiliensis]
MLVRPERYKTMSAVFLIIVKDGKVLLQKRKDTGYCDGWYDCGASGHVEADESTKQAAVRELAEELRVEIPMDRLDLATTIHIRSNDKVYYYFYFALELAGDEEFDFVINEPDKNDELIWVDLNHLPDRLIDYNQIAIHNYQEGIPYSEIGWNY